MTHPRTRRGSKRSSKRSSKRQSKRISKRGGGLIDNWKQKREAQKGIKQKLKEAETIETPINELKEALVELSKKIKVVPVSPNGTETYFAVRDYIVKHYIESSRDLRICFNNPPCEIKVPSTYKELDQLQTEYDLLKTMDIVRMNEVYGIKTPRNFNDEIAQEARKLDANKLLKGMDIGNQLRSLVDNIASEYVTVLSKLGTSWKAGELALVPAYKEQINKLTESFAGMKNELFKNENNTSEDAILLRLKQLNSLLSPSVIEFKKFIKDPIDMDKLAEMKPEEQKKTFDAAKIASVSDLVEEVNQTIKNHVKVIVQKIVSGIEESEKEIEKHYPDSSCKREDAAEGAPEDDAKGAAEGAPEDDAEGAAKNATSTTENTIENPPSDYTIGGKPRRKLKSRSKKLSRK